MTRSPKLRLLSALLLLGLLTSAAACSSRDDDDDASTGGNDTSGDSGGDVSSSIDTADCITDPTTEIEGDTIKLVSSYPQSGLTAAFAEIAVGWQSYFSMINDEGGVEIAGTSYQIEWETKDDEYNSAETVSNLEEMLGSEGDDAFAAFSVVGTANNLAVRDTLGEECVPDLFAATGSPAWGNPAYPWLIGSTLSPYTLEGQVFADLLGQELPEAKVAMLVQDDDFGKAYEDGLRQAIEGTDIEIVKVEKYATGASEVSAQITSLAASGADAFFDGATLLACPAGLQSAADANWDPTITWVSSTCTSKTLMGIAGADAAGVYSISNLKDPQDPSWDDDAAMQEYRDKVEQYFPGTDTDNGIVGYGWTQGAARVEALRQAEAPTRLAVMESVRNLDLGDDVGILLPGTGITTSDDDPFMGERLNLSQYGFEGPDARNHFTIVGDVYDFEGQTADLAPAELVEG
jgi:branched-chain amino acid transport system substrate-binding protein